MRRRELSVEIEAPIESVWKALVDADEIVRWYAPEAAVDARVGGRYWVSWGEGMEGATRIAALEADKRLVLETEQEPAMVNEYLLESRGDVTVLRLVQSGIPDSADWDDFYEDTGRGWKMFLAGLKHYLERHAGHVRANITFMQPVLVPVEQAWERLLGPDGLGVEGSLEVGKRMALTTGLGQALDVEVLVHEPPRTLTMTIDNLQDSLLALDFERIGDETVLYANLSTFTLDPSRVDELRSRWKAWVERMFPVSPRTPG